MHKTLNRPTAPLTPADTADVLALLETVLAALTAPFTIDDVEIVDHNKQGEDLVSRKFLYTRNRAVRARLRSLRTLGMRHNVEVRELRETTAPEGKFRYEATVRLTLTLPDGSTDWHDGVSVCQMKDAAAAAKGAVSGALVRAAEEHGVGAELYDCGDTDRILVDAYHRAGDRDQMITEAFVWRATRALYAHRGTQLPEIKHTSEQVLGEDGKPVKDADGRLLMTNREPARRRTLILKAAAALGFENRDADGQLADLSGDQLRAFLRAACAAAYHERRNLTTTTQNND